jgi:photosystem II stability/assembly factor-like uncharacterized protein
MIKNVLLCVLICTAFSCSKQVLEIHTEYPAEWMYNQRAYPDNIINQKAINDAWKIFNNQRFQRNSNIGNWVQKGPLNIGGRITDLAFSPTNDQHIYVAASTGGIFRSYDFGINWDPIFDGWGRPSIGALAIAPSDANRVYAGTGEANGGFDSGSYFGDGVYRSDDAGDTWENIGLPLSNHIARIVVDPVDPDRVFAASTGILYGTNQERGLYRTVNGGEDWEQVLYVSDSTACIDVVMNLQNSDILFAAMWERRRMPWIRDYGGVTSGVHRSLDGGDTWELMGNGLPVSDTETGRIGLAMSPTDPEVIYASYTTNSITNEFAALYQSTDNGDSWQEISQGQLDGINSTFGWYFGNLRVSPEDPGLVWVLGQGLALYDANETFSNPIGGMHVDHHAMAFSPSDPYLILAGNDGGLYYSTNGGDNWTHFENIPLTQCYQIEVDYNFPERLYTGTQDNNTLRTISGDPASYNSILGGDGFHVNVDPIDNSYVYAEYQWGNLFRSTTGGDNMQDAMSGIDQSDRTNWNTPVILSPADPTVLYYGANRLYRSTDRAQSWSAISPDLTGGLHPSGSLSYGTISCIGASYENQDIVYVGTDDGHVQRTLNGGDSWEEVDADLPNRFVSDITVHPSDPLTVYASFSGYSLLDYTPHLFKTTDGGLSWTDVSGDLPDIPINDVLIDAVNERLYIATDMSVWFSVNDGETWNILGTDLPGVIVNDLKLHIPTNTLVAGTYGRSMYSYDLSQLDNVGLEESAHNLEFALFPNPADEQIQVQLAQHFNGLISYSIIDAKGSTVLTGTLTEVSATHSLILAPLASGKYLLEVRSDRYVGRKGFVVGR